MQSKVFQLIPIVLTFTFCCYGNELEKAEKKLSVQILAFLEHYKQDDPIGLPDHIPVPDPLPVPDIRKSLGMANLNMMNVKAYGLSKFRIIRTDADLKNLKVEAAIQLDQMDVKGNYTLSSFLSKATGPFSVILKNLITSGNATLMVGIDGKIKTQYVKLDAKFSEMAMDFQNLGFLGSIFQGVINSAPNLVFDSIKPLMLDEASGKIREEIDQNIAKFISDGRTLPNSVSPLDIAISEVRRKVKEYGYDPFKVREYNQTVGLFTMKLSNTWIRGLASIHRVGNMTLTMEKNTMKARIELGTLEISGFTQWEVSLGSGILGRAGHAKFSIQHIKISVAVGQSLDTRNKPFIDNLDIYLGNIQIRCDGAGTLDYVMEFLVNVLPNLLRYQIMDALENPIRTRIQEKLDAIDVESFIKRHISSLDDLNLEKDFNIELFLNT